MTARLEKLQEHWNVLAQVAAWIITILAGFIVAPPAGVLQGGDSDALWNLARFVVTVLVGLMLVLTTLNSTKDSLSLWISLTVAMLILFIVMYFVYGMYLNAWTVSYSNELRVIGETLTDHGKRFAGEHPELVLKKDWVYYHAGETREIWKGEEVNARQTWLQVLFLPVVCLPACCIMAAIQTAYLVSKSSSKNDDVVPDSKEA